MKKRIAILGSTGSIGKILLNIVKKNEKLFKIILLTANKDYKTLYTQAKTRKSYLFLSQQHGINGKSCQEDDNYHYLLSSCHYNTSCDPLKKQINLPRGYSYNNFFILHSFAICYPNFD